MMGEKNAPSDLIPDDPDAMEYEERVAAAAELWWWNKSTQHQENQQWIANKLNVSARTIRKYKDEPVFWETIREVTNDDHYDMLELANRALRENIEEGEMRAIETLYELTGMFDEDPRGSEREPIELVPYSEEEHEDDDEEDHVMIEGADAVG